MNREGMPIDMKDWSPERPKREPLNSSPVSAWMASMATSRVSAIACPSVRTVAPRPPGGIGVQVQHAILM